MVIGLLVVFIVGLIFTFIGLISNEAIIGRIIFAIIGIFLIIWVLLLIRKVPQSLKDKIIDIDDIKVTYYKDNKIEKEILWQNCNAICFMTYWNIGSNSEGLAFYSKYGEKSNKLFEFESDMGFKMNDLIQIGKAIYPFIIKYKIEINENFKKHILAA
jgi:hypothetical protein